MNDQTYFLANAAHELQTLLSLLCSSIQAIEAAHPEPAHVDGAQPQESATPVVREVVAQPTTTVETTLPEPANVSTAVQQQEAQAPVAQESVAQSAPQPE